MVIVIVANLDPHRSTAFWEAGSGSVSSEKPLAVGANNVAMEANS
jgi:hypothetical protein